MKVVVSNGCPYVGEVWPTPFLFLPREERNKESPGVPGDLRRMEREERRSK